MNDFSKQELIFLHETLSHMVQDYHEPDSTYELRDKIKFIMANYCDHHESGEVEIFVDVCGKCDALMLRNKTLEEYNE